MDGKLTIGELAELFGVSTDTLRYYEKAGILSSQKNDDNGYRYYSNEEVIVLMDILFFRSMKLSIKDIKQIITKMGIADIKKLLYQNQRLIEDRIRELTKLKKTIIQVVSHYEQCEQHVGNFSIVPAPNFKYKLLGKQADDLVAILRKYKKEGWDWLDSIRYTLLIPQKDLLKKPNFNSAQAAISIDQENLYLLDAAEQRELASLPEAEYLYTIVQTNYCEQDNDVLGKAMEYLKEEGRQVGGPMIGRYMASSHKDGLDYYEVWIASNKVDLSSAGV